MHSNKKPFYRKRYVAWLYLLVILATGVALLWSWQQDSRIETDLTSLLPQDAQSSEAMQAAKVRMNQRMNRDIVILVGGESADAVLTAADEIQSQWQNSGLFQSVTGKIEPDIAKLQQTIAQLSIASVPDAKWQEVMTEPKAAFDQQAAALVNPFAERSILPVEQDWLGLGNAIVHQASQDGPVFYNAQTGWLSIENDGKTWVLLRASLPEKSGLINAPDGLLPLIDNTLFDGSQKASKRPGISILMAGGAIFAAENKAIGQSEGQYMSVLGMGLTFLLLLSLFKTIRVLTLFLSLGAGVLMGLAATIAIFGHVHILTLVVGTSLVGVLLDFPLHWLASGVVQTNWLRYQALHIASKAFVLSLVITLLGYIALLVTPLPILQQTAVFSATALLAAFLFSLWCLPPFFATWQPKMSTSSLRMMLFIGQGIGKLKAILQARKWLLVLLLALLVNGIVRVNTQDDIRQWAHLSPVWLSEAQQIGQLTQTMPSGQYMVVVADNDDALLAKTQTLSKTLAEQAQQQNLSGFQALSQWVAPVAEQEKRRQAIGQLLAQPQNWQGLVDLGVDNQSVTAYLQTLQQTAPLGIAESLNNDLATAWQDLYLGRLPNGQVAGLVLLSGLKNEADLQKTAALTQDVYFVDERQSLNRLFNHTRNIAIVLKVASYALAIVLLAYVFGWKKGLGLLSVPVLASLWCVAVFGYMGWTLSLFAIFGLFLVTAIGMDYAIYVSMTQMAVKERLAGVLLAALTTMISFAVLGFSATPAIASFGRSVAFGVLFSVILALALLPAPKNKEES